MARWLVVVVVVLGGAFLLSQWFGEESTAEAGEAPGLKVSQGAVAAQRPESPEPRAEVASRDSSNLSEGAGGGRRSSAEPASKSERQEGPSVAALLDRAEALHLEGRRADAVALLRDGRGKAESARDQARLGLKLAFLGGGPRERRQLVGEALAHRQVLGAEYEEVNALLNQLNTEARSALTAELKTASYRVRPNDSLWKLCHRTLPEMHGVEPEVGLIKLLNGLKTDGLQVDQELVVPLDEIKLVVDREQRGLTAWLGTVPVAAFRVGLGKDGSTPSGEFTVQVKQENPAWTFENQTIPFGDSRNILGTRWLGFEDHPGVTGYGIHGTAKPETIGRDESMGCVRMRNPEVEALFELVPRGTRVAIP
ncbi:MAG: hypothetical protein DHS20C15_04610 [Planctomycetota bacterium]|nr:MAG: hypothetical protein DHS20C15_04610 [Planctomycetota bacterium]